MYGTLGFNIICVNLYRFPMLLQSGSLFKNNDALHNNRNIGPKYNSKICIKVNYHIFLKFHNNILTFGSQVVEEKLKITFSLKMNQFSKGRI